MNPLKVKLSVMMFLQYAVWGVWAPVLAVHLGRLESFRDDTGWKIGMIYLTMAIASMLAPMIAGQLVDRFFATEKYLAFSHIAGGIALIYAGTLTDFNALFWIMLVHCFFYAPTVPLTNSLSFAHLPDAEADFGKIRLWGTIGWAAIGFAFGAWIASGIVISGHLPAMGDALYVGGGLGILMGLFSLVLPNTPPSKKSSDAFAFLKAFGLVKDRSFAVLLFIAFLVSTELQFYYVLTPSFFSDKSGLSLSKRELILATEFQGDDAGKQATTLMQAFDLNRNQKLDRDELHGDQVAARMTELQAALFRLQGKTEAMDEKALAIELAEAKIGTEERKDAQISAYIVKTVDANQDQKVDIGEVQAFLEKLNPLMPTVPMAFANFDRFATEKGGLSLEDKYVGPVMGIGQLAEILVLLLLPFSLRALGYGPTIAIGIAAWAVRYALFAWGDPKAIVIASQALHGFGFAFFFVGTFLYADRIAPRDIRSSAQALIIFITYGAGMVVSSLIAGPIADYFEFNWQKIFLVPVGITAACTIVFLIGFRETKAPIVD